MKSFFIPKQSVTILLSALLLFAASPGRWSVPALMWVALVPLISACLSAEMTPKAAAGLGITCGLLYYLSLLYWITIALGRYGGLPLPMSLIALTGLALYMALYVAGFTVILATTKDRLPVTLTAPIAWVALDQIKAWLFTGFPWQDLGYSQFQSPLLTQIADLTGHSGVTFLIVMINAAAASLLCWKHCPASSRHSPQFVCLPTVGALLLTLCSIGYAWHRIPQIDQEIAQAPTMTAAVMQGNIDQSEKWSPDGQGATVQTYVDLTKQATAGEAIDLAIWPETALPFFPLENPLLHPVAALAELPSSPEILTGAPHYSHSESGPARYYNSAFLITQENHNGMPRYDKQQLVPFGEYVPLQKILGILPIASSMGNFSPGRSAAPLHSRTANLGVLICFESIFPALARQRTNAGADLLINLTNDAWYGVSSAPYQQISMAVFRAIENRRTLARAANTGISCFIDPVGRIMQASPIFTQLFLVESLPLLDQQSLFSRRGFIFPPVCLILLSLIVLYGIVGRYNPR